MSPDDEGTADHAPAPSSAPRGPPQGPSERRPGVSRSPMQRMSKGPIQNVIAVGSGKGGVGKSAVTALLASELARRGKKVGVLDADVTGPSIPKLLGVKGPLLDKGEGIEPAVSSAGIEVVSSQFLVEDAETPVVWRGPLVTRLIMQFFGGVNWGPIDYLLLDMPPGTSDVPLTVFQAIPTDGMVFVSTPQELAGLIVKKAVNMARELHIPLLGLVENMAYVRCPKCQEEIRLYGPSRGEKLAEEYGIPFLGSLPVDTAVSELGDAGRLSELVSPAIGAIADGFLRSYEASRARTLNVL